MKGDISKQRAMEPEGVRQHLTELRNALLPLHKSLIDSERIGYEQAVGKIESPNQFLQLLTTDPWFVWLKPMSQLIVALDEVLDGKEPLTSAVAEALVSQTFQLLTPSETGKDFSRQYFEALQRDPDVVLAHAKVGELKVKR